MKLINEYKCICSCETFYIKKDTKTNGGIQTGLYCSGCGRWIKWLGKEELRLYERKLEMDKINFNVVMEVEEPEVEISLSQYSDEELLNEIRRRMR